MNTPLRQLGEWLATREPALKKGTTKGWLAAGTVILGALSVWLPNTLAMKIVLPILGASLLTVLWLLSWVLVQNNTIARLQSGPSTKDAKEGTLSLGKADFSEEIGALTDIRVLIGQVATDKQLFATDTTQRMAMEHVQTDLERIFRRIQHKFGIPDKDAPL